MFLYTLYLPSHAGLLLRWPPYRAPAGRSRSMRPQAATALSSPVRAFTPGCFGVFSCWCCALELSTPPVHLIGLIVVAIALGWCSGCSFPLGSASVWAILLVFGASPSLLYGCYFWLCSSRRPRPVGCRPPLCPGLDLPPDASLSAFLPNWRLVASLCRYCSYSPFSAALSGRPVWLSVHSPSCMLTSRLIHLSKGPGR